jgi:hypothetical protein
VGVGQPRLFEAKEGLLLPVADQAFGEGGLVGFEAAVAQFGQRRPVAFAAEDGIEDRQARLPLGQVVQTWPAGRPAP